MNFLTKEIDFLAKQSIYYVSVTYLLNQEDTRYKIEFCNDKTTTNADFLN